MVNNLFANVQNSIIWCIMCPCCADIIANMTFKKKYLWSRYLNVCGINFILFGAHIAGLGFSHCRRAPQIAYVCSSYNASSLPTETLMFGEQAYSQSRHVICFNLHIQRRMSASQGYDDAEYYYLIPRSSSTISPYQNIAVIASFR